MVDFERSQPREGERRREEPGFLLGFVARSPRVALFVARGRFLLPVRGEETSPRVGRTNEATDLLLTYKVCNFDLYHLVQTIHIGPSGYRYVDRPLPGGSAKNQPSTADFDCRQPIEEEIDRQRSIEREIDRRRSIEEEKGKKKGRKRGKEEKKKRRIPCSHAVLARGLPAPRRRPRVGRGRFFSRARRRSFSPRGEKDRGD
ncbi:hypothetical protein BHM03_00042148, partial [Ensete ventricosum]